MEEQAKKKRKRDGVWEHVLGEDNAGICWCNCCKKEWNFSITEKVEIVRKHFGVDKNGMRLPGNSGKCRCNPYSSSVSSSSISAHLVAAMSPALQKQFQSEIASFFYESGTPFVKVGHRKINSAVRLLRADAVLPTRKELSGRMLLEQYKILTATVMNHLKKTNEKICLTTDGWSTQHRFPLTNYMAVCAGRAYFYESEMTGENAHTSEFIAERLAHIINEIGVQRISGAATDNTNANK